jgi:hypothetical protein
MSACGRLALKAVETKKKEAGFKTQDTMKDLHQLAGYMFSTVACSMWGVMKSTKPIVGLLVYPSAIYRLSIWKPEDSSKVPLGLHHKLEYTSDPLMMGWFLETFLREYEADYLSVKRMESTLDFEHVDPADWTCVNFKFGTPLAVVSESKSSLRFLFESDGARVLRWMDCISKKYRGNVLIQCEQIHQGEKLIVKYLSALSTSPPEQSFQPILRIVEAHHRAQQMDALARQKDAEKDALARQKDAEKDALARQKDAEKEAELEAQARKHDAEKKALARQRDAEKEELTRQIAELRLEALKGGRPADIKTETQSASMRPSPESKPEIDENAQVSEVSNVEGPADIKSETQSASPQPSPAATPPTTASTQPSPAMFCFKIKHPYIAVITAALVHPFLIMRNVGTSLAAMSAQGAFLGKWKSCQELRRKFRDDVGISALNLVESLNLCHNDIRLSNIAVHNDSFCLIDFGHSRPDVPNHALESLVLRRYHEASNECNMMYTIAQIGVVVFALDTGAQAAEVRDVCKYWLTGQSSNSKSRQLANFDAWVRSKGGLVEMVFSKTVLASGQTIGNKSSGYYISILNAMLA